MKFIIFLQYNTIHKQNLKHKTNKICTIIIHYKSYSNTIQQKKRERPHFNLVLSKWQCQHHGGYIAPLNIDSQSLNEESTWFTCGLSYTCSNLTDLALSPHAPIQECRREPEMHMYMYFLLFCSSAWQANLATSWLVTEWWDCANVSHDVKSHKIGQTPSQGMRDIPLGCFPLSRHTPTSSKTDGTPPDTRAQWIVSLAAWCLNWNAPPTPMTA